MPKKSSLPKGQVLAVRKMSNPKLHFHVVFTKGGLVGSLKTMRMGGSLTSMYVQFVLKMENLTPTPPRTAKDQKTSEAKK